MGNKFLLGAPAGVLGSGVDGPRRNQLLIAQIMKILEEYVKTESEEKKSNKIQNSDKGRKQKKKGRKYVLTLKFHC